MKKRCVSSLLALILILSLCPMLSLNAAAATVQITDPSDEAIATMLSGIDLQSFEGSCISASQAKEYMSHYIIDSSFAAVGGGAFPYPNSGGFNTYVTDGVYGTEIYGSKGCCAYCYYLSTVMYGTKGVRIGEARQSAESLRTLLMTYAQAGEHIRINNYHSVTFISGDNEGFYCLSYRGDSTGAIALYYYTYDAFVSEYAGRSIGLFDANTAVNTAKSNAQSVQPTENTRSPGEPGMDNFIDIRVYNGVFCDVNSSAWYYDGVAEAYGLGLMNGTAAASFGVGGSVTVAQAITMASRLHSIYYTGLDSFPQTEPWYAAYVDYAAKNGISTRAYDSYDRAATRAEFAELFAAALPEAALPAINSVSAIPDLGQGSEFAQPVYELYRAGVLTGDAGTGSFRPGSAITREEAATIVTRMADGELRKAFSL